MGGVARPRGWAGSRGRRREGSVEPSLDRGPAWSPGLVQGGEQQGADGSDHMIPLTETPTCTVSSEAAPTSSPLLPPGQPPDPHFTDGEVEAHGGTWLPQTGMPSGSGSL